MKQNNAITGSSRAMLIFSAILLTVSIFVPIWQIDLIAPQYPEGLKLLIYADKLGGNVDIINGLNHYIGMKTLHSDDFIEFTVLPYVIGFFALFSIVAGIVGKRKLLYTLFILFALFGVVAMADFWRWEYEYGHNLDPTAAIIVPGMAYQPPLIGFKQLLNFGAYSIPDVGGWLFIGSGVLMLFSCIVEVRIARGTRRVAIPVMAGLALLTMMSCSSREPEAIKLNSDNCDYCRMTISDARFATELITEKGRIYKFDDLSCMQNYISENENTAKARTFVCNFSEPGIFIETSKAFYISGENVNSPMGGNVAAFATNDEAGVHARKLDAQITTEP